MFTLSASARRTSVLLLFCLAAFVRVARADLVWDPHHGWKIEGGVMSGLMGSEGRTALHMMN